MSNLEGARRFNELPAEDQARYRATGQQLVRVAQRYAVPIIFAPPPVNGGVINGASGSVLQLGDGYFVVTASHVLEGYEGRVRSGEKLNWQVGNLPPFDPLSRITWRDCGKDTLLLRLSPDEARRVGCQIASASMARPPTAPKAGQLVLGGG